MEQRAKSVLIISGGMSLIILMMVVRFVYLPGPSAPEIPEENVSSFEECLNAGFNVSEGFPRTCMTPSGKVFTDEVMTNAMYACVDKCGDGVCDKNVCTKPECPCAETPRTCARDCLVYRIVEIRNESCFDDADCDTPMDYFTRSGCQYASKCVNSSCAVICPEN